MSAIIRISKRTATKRGRAEKSAASFSDNKSRGLDEIVRDKAARAKVKKNITQEILKIRKSGAGTKVYSPPYTYIYADYLKNGKFEKLTRAIENRLTDLGISGKIHRLSQFKNLEEIIEEDARRGVSTAVVVGDDEMVKEAIKIVVDLDIVLGIIPVGNGGDAIANLFGIPQGIAACDVLSQRIVDFLDIGKINNKIFFSRLSIFGQKSPLICDNKYEIFSPGGDIIIYNLNLDPKDKDAAGINPKDSRLEILVKSKVRTGFLKKSIAPSLFFARELRMRSAAPFSVFVDGKKNFYKDINVEAVPKGLKVIVGRGRQI